jgi:hypothetical protein
MKTLLRFSVLVLAGFGTACDPLSPPELARAGTASLAVSNAHVAASGTFTQTAITSLESRQAGPNTILNQTSAGLVSGTLSGTYTDELRVVLHPNGRFNAHFTIRCECTVNGEQGVVNLAASDHGQMTGPTTATFAGSAVIQSATAALFGMKGNFRIDGAVDLVSGLSTYTYSGRIH